MLASYVKRKVVFSFLRERQRVDEKEENKKTEEGKKRRRQKHETRKVRADFRVHAREEIISGVVSCTQPSYIHRRIINLAAEEFSLPGVKKQRGERKLNVSRDEERFASFFLSFSFFIPSFRFDSLPWINWTSRASFLYFALTRENRKIVTLWLKLSWNDWFEWNNRA